MQELFGLGASQASVHKATLDAQTLLKPTVNAIAQAVTQASVAHADETGGRVHKGIHWIHTVSTESLTWMGCHA